MDLLNALPEEGTSHYLILCYSVFPVSEVDLAYKKIDKEFPNENHYKLHEDSWPYAIILSEFRQTVAPDIISTITNLLTKSFQAGDCKASLCMLDGAFINYDDLFSPAIASQIYAFCVRPNEPVIAMDNTVRSGDDWRAIIAKQRQYVGS